MAHWNSATEEIVYFAPEWVDGYPGWLRVDCGCCNGICWGGSEPNECQTCWASGSLFLHVSTRRLAQWPGGPMNGSMSVAEVEDLITRIEAL